MTEMHGNKRHGYAIDVYDSNIYEAKYYNGELVMIIIRRLHDLRIYSIKYLDTGRILHDNGELTYFRIKMGNFYLSNGFYENGKFRYSIITDGSNSYCAKYDGNGKCTLYRNSEEY